MPLHNTEELLKRAVEALDDYLNAGHKLARESASQKARLVYEEYYNRPYKNKIERTDGISIYERCINQTAGNTINSNVKSAVRLAIFKRDEYRCLKCGGAENLTIDHIVPLSKGGVNKKFNLQTLCKRCNSEKGSDIACYIEDYAEVVSNNGKHWAKMKIPSAGKSDGMVRREAQEINGKKKKSAIQSVKKGIVEKTATPFDWNAYSESIRARVERQNQESNHQPS